MTAVLALDTSSKFVSLSIAREDRMLLEYNFSSKDELSSTLLPALNFLLAEVSLSIAQIDVFAVAVGPGLFTGLRVGMATLKGLLLSSGKPVVPVNNLFALAFKHKDVGSPICTLIDARRNECYCGVYRLVDNVPTEVLEPRLLHIDQLKSLPCFSDRSDTSDRLDTLDRFTFAGSGAVVHHAFLEENFPGCRVSVRSDFLAAEIAHIGLEEFRMNRFVTDLQQLMPLYIRKPDAEQNFQANQTNQTPQANQAVQG